MAKIVTADTLNGVVEFDSPFVIHPADADGNVTISPAPDGVYAPEVTDVHTPADFHSDRWELVTGYSGQHGYAGPIMHDSEYLGGGMARDVLAEPGTYVVIAACWTPEMPEVDADWPVTELDDDDPATDRVTCGECGRSWDDAIATSMTPAPSARCPFEAFHAPDEDGIEGWALARLRD